MEDGLLALSVNSLGHIDMPGFDWIFFAIVIPWPLLAIGRLVMMRFDPPRDRN